LSRGLLEELCLLHIKASLLTTFALEHSSQKAVFSRRNLRCSVTFYVHWNQQVMYIYIHMYISHDNNDDDSDNGNDNENGSDNGNDNGNDSENDNDKDDLNNNNKRKKG